VGLQDFNEDDLYVNLDWLHEHQAEIENRLFRHRHPDGKANLFLYDVTSSYLEGVKNELGAFGYSRDKKTGKLQIVIGMLCDEQGWHI
jgi:transposase